jgi:hypothetical protein
MDLIYSTEKRIEYHFLNFQYKNIHMVGELSSHCIKPQLQCDTVYAIICVKLCEGLEKLIIEILIKQTL